MNATGATFLSNVRLIMKQLGEDYWADLIGSAIGDGLLQLTFTTIHATGLFCPQIAATLAITEYGMQVANQAQECKVKSTTISTTEG